MLDEVSGEGRHSIDTLVHLAPNADCRIGESYVDVSLDPVKLRLHPYRHPASPVSTVSCIRGAENPIQGWYAQEFGMRTPNSVLIFSSDAALPTRLGYLIAPADREITSWAVEINDLGKPIQVVVSVLSPQGNVVEHFDAHSATSGGPSTAGAQNMNRAS